MEFVQWLTYRYRYRVGVKSPEMVKLIYIGNSLSIIYLICLPIGGGYTGAHFTRTVMCCIMMC